MSKSALYAYNSAAQALTVGATINPGAIVRRFGSNVNLTGTGITLSGTGYYDVDAEVTLNGTTAGTATIQLFRDGVAVPGAIATVSLASGDVATVGINALVRETCCSPNSVLTFVLDSTAETVSNFSVVVEKI